MTRNKRKGGALRFLIYLPLAAASLLVLLGAAAFAAFLYLDNPPREIPPEGRLFTVGYGESGVGIARRLKDQGLIRSSMGFEALLRVKKRQSSLKTGTYRIESGMRSSEILDLLVSGKQALVRVTIPEGLTMRQIAEQLSKAQVVDRDSFLAAARDPEVLSVQGIPASSAEGYLFPDTYFLARGMPGAEVVAVMTGALKKRLAERMPESAGLGPEEIHRRIILASIVEREYRLSEEAPRIAGVFWNRLRIGMGLQSCATVVYIITEIQGKPHPRFLLTRDTEVENPYNTYLYAGLPPGPISNPGMTALEAVFRPEPSRYLYFRLTDPAKGAHYFSESLDEHIRASSFAVKGVGGR